MTKKPFPSDLEIALAADLWPISKIAAESGISEDRLEPYGKYVAKVLLDESTNAETARKRGSKYIVVTAVTPTPLGEGKTATSVSLAQGFAQTGRKAALALRQPAMGPTFGIKGGAAGGGYSQIVPMEKLNLHLTGDFHAVTAAHNLLAAMIDNHLHHGNELRIDPRAAVWAAWVTPRWPRRSVRPPASRCWALPAKRLTSCWSSSPLRMWPWWVTPRPVSPR